MTMIKTTLSSALLAAGIAAILAPGLASADTGDAAYCTALVKKYETYLDMGSKRGRQPQSLESREAAARCKAGDSAGIAGLEKALNNAKIPLPSRG